MTHYCCLVNEVAMLLALLAVSQLITVAVANPVQKYPFVFLLDVGNEELEKTNTEQIRLSLPGGSVALRYPAIGNGDVISHVRVSEVDFGTDLKANIVDGGPGYNYVVLTFIGNPGVPFDAVLTVQTLPDDKSDTNYIDSPVDEGASMKTDNNYDPYSVEEDKNDSAEDTSDLNGQYSEVTNAELTQSSSNLQYNYAINSDYPEKDGNTKYDKEDDENEEDDGDDDDDDESEVNEEELENYNENEKYYVKGTSRQEYSNADQEFLDNDVQVDGDSGNYRAESLYQQEEPVKVDRNLYNMYQELRPHLNGVNVVSQDENDQEKVDEEYPEDRVEIDEMFNDEEVHGEGKYRDSNNNNFDADDTSAVAY